MHLVRFYVFTLGACVLAGTWYQIHLRCFGKGGQYSVVAPCRFLFFTPCGTRLSYALALPRPVVRVVRTGCVRVASYCCLIDDVPGIYI